jgi:small GTP-binding protein
MLTVACVALQKRLFVNFAGKTSNMSVIASYLPGQAELRQIVTNLAGWVASNEDCELNLKDLSSYLERTMPKLDTYEELAQATYRKDFSPDFHQVSEKIVEAHKLAESDKKNRIKSLICCCTSFKNTSCFGVCGFRLFPSSATTKIKRLKNEIEELIRGITKLAKNQMPYVYFTNKEARYFWMREFPREREVIFDGPGKQVLAHKLVDHVRKSKDKELQRVSLNPDFTKKIFVQLVGIMDTDERSAFITLEMFEQFTAKDGILGTLRRLKSDLEHGKPDLLLRCRSIKNFEARQIWHDCFLPEYLSVETSSSNFQCDVAQREKIEKPLHDAIKRSHRNHFNASKQYRHLTNAENLNKFIDSMCSGPGKCFLRWGVFNEITADGIHKAACNWFDTSTRPNVEPTNSSDMIDSSGSSKGTQKEIKIKKKVSKQIDKKAVSKTSLNSSGSSKGTQKEIKIKKIVSKRIDKKAVVSKTSLNSSGSSKDTHKETKKFDIKAVSKQIKTQFTKKTKYRKFPRLDAQEVSYDLKIKICLLGDSNVGKTSLIKQYCHGEFDPDQPTTYNADHVDKYIELDDGSSVRATIWDTAGQERFASLIPLYIRNSDMTIVVVDLTSDRSLEYALHLDKEHASKNMFYLANKADLKEQRTISYETIRDSLYEDYQKHCDRLRTIEIIDNGPGTSEFTQPLITDERSSSMIPDFEFRCREVSAKYEDEVNKIFTDWIKNVAVQITPVRKRETTPPISFKREKRKGDCC